MPPFLKGKGQGWVTAEYAMLPASTTERKKRDGIKKDGRGVEIQRLIGRSLRQVRESISDRQPELIFMTGGVSRMEELRQWCREVFPEAVVCDAVIYTISGANPDGSVTQTGQFTHMFVGSREKDERHQQCARDVAQLFMETGFDCRFTENIEGEIWQKFVLNCAFNTLTARHRTTTGGIRENEKMKADIHSLLSEAYRAGIAEGVQLPDDLVEVKYDYVIYRQPAEGTSSMARDVEAHRTIELDAFTGTVLRLSQKHGLAAPVTQEYHEALRNMTKQG